MKKFIYLLFLLPMAFLASCNNDDDFPQVDLTLEINNVYQDQTTGKLYYVEGGDSPVIESLTASSLESGKNAAVTNVFYYLNRVVRLFGTEEDPFTPVIPGQLLEEGVNYINISATVLQEDKSIAYLNSSVPLIVVDEEKNLPVNIGELTTGKVTLKIQNEK